MNLKKLFLDHCEEEQYEINQNQLDLINNLGHYYKSNLHATLIYLKCTIFELSVRNFSANLYKLH